MVKRLLSVLLLCGAGLLWGQETPSEDEKGPTLFGDGGGRVWSWSGGEKTLLSPEGKNWVLGGVGEGSLWGWSIEGDHARFFLLELPQDQGEKKDAVPAPEAVYDPKSFPPPDRADLVGNRRLLVWGTRDGHPRYEVWQADQQLAARAWDDGRSVFAVALGPEEGWILAGRSADGAPWLEVSGEPVLAPEGWRGRLTVALWVPEKDDKNSESEPSTVHPWAAGWGAPGSATPRLLLWGPEGWIEPAPSEEVLLVATYPLFGTAQEGTLLLAGWQAEDNGVLRPWFWDGEAAEVPGGSADGQPQAYSVGGKSGAFLIVRHQSSPWFTLEDGKESLPLLGLDADDRVVAVANEPASP